MIGQTHKLRRITVAVALATSLAAWSAQTALAFDGRSPDTRDTAEHANLGVVVDARSPDTRDAAEHARTSTAVSIVDARSPDTRDAANAAKDAPLIDLRSPDTRDAANYAKDTPFVDHRSPDARHAGFPRVSEIRMVAPDLTSPDRFHWGDFGIGVGVAFGSMLLLAGVAAGGLAARQKRGQKTSPATT